MTRVTPVTASAPILPVKGDFEVAKLPEPMTRRRYAAMNEQGTQRIGEDHHRAKLSDAQVDAIRDQYEKHPVGHRLHVGCKTLAIRWGVSRRVIRDIVSYRSRNQWAGSWKRIG